MKEIKKPDTIKLYEQLKKTINEYETYILYLQDEESKAEYDDHNECKKRMLCVEECCYQEIVNNLYDITGFLESRFME